MAQFEVILFTSSQPAFSKKVRYIKHAGISQHSLKKLRPKSLDNCFAEALIYNGEKPKLFHSEYFKWSPTHKYKHQTTGEHCTFAAYLAEYLIWRREEAFRNPKPPYKFWSKGEKLHLQFMRQVRAANKLLKKFDEKTILGAVNSPHFNNIYFIGIC